MTLTLDDALGVAAGRMRRRKTDTDDRVGICARDVREFAKHVWLSDPVTGEQPFEMWDWQPGLLGLWMDNRKCVVLKARQLGVSWLVAVYVLWVAMFHPSARVLLVSIGQREADELLDKVKFVLRKLPDWLRPMPSLYTANVRTLTFHALDSEIESLPASSASGRSRSASLVVLDEHAHQEQDAAIWTAIKPAVERGQLISVSTANGLGPLHTRLYKGAKEGGTGDAEDMVPVFIPWSAHPDRDGKWLNREKREMAMTGQPEMFAQEYPENDVEAFVVSGSPVWTVDQIEKQPIERIAPTEPGLWIYREPEKDGTYSIGVDTAEGIVGGDWCSASVVRLFKDDDGYHGEQVAILRGLWPPEIYAEKVDALARRYSVAFRPRYRRTVLVGVERNNHGHAVLLKLRQLNPKDEPYGISAWKGRLGWVTDTQTRPLMYDEFAGAIRGDIVTIRDPVTQDQMSTFAQTRAGGDAQSGYHDDDLTGVAIAWQHHRRAFGVTIDMPRGTDR